MPVRRLKDFLDSENIRYISIVHSPAFTADVIAAMTHTPGKEMAKTVIVSVDGEMAMAVLPASQHVDVLRLKSALKAREVVLASEEEFASRFQDCEVGAMPPFGNLYGMDVFVEEGLTADKEIAFNAGTHRELIRLAYADFDRLVKPVVLRFATGKAAGAAAQQRYAS